jgi:hypothetical protein
MSSEIPGGRVILSKWKHRRDCTHCSDTSNAIGMNVIEKVGHTSEKWKSTIVTSGGRRSATDMKWKWSCDIVPETRKINGSKSQRHTLARDGFDSPGEKKKSTKPTKREGFVGIE